MDNACVIGFGVVGQATAKAFGIDKHFDIDESKSNITLEEAAGYRYIFICLPTPVKEGNYDTVSIQSTIRQLYEYGFKGYIILRSTVIPGTAKALQEEYKFPIVSNPEFLDEKTAEYDAQHPGFIVIGAEQQEDTKAVRALYEARFKGADIIETDTITAETLKVSLNAFFATKVIFANEIYELCQKNGANYEKVKDALQKHRYGSKNHFEIWHKGGRGAGGRCLPKDLEAFATYINRNLFDKIVNINRELLEKYPKTEQ